MKLEVGKFYRTRDGRKAGPVNRKDYESSYQFWVDVPEVRGLKSVFNNGYTETGRYFMREEDPRDLVALWDEPTAADANQSGPTDEQVVEAFNRLVKEGRVQFSELTENHPDFKNTRWNDQDAVQRLKPPAPVVRKMHLPDSGYEVQYPVQGRVQIGCQDFDFTWLRVGLAGLCRQGVTQSDGTTPLVAIRYGVQYSDHTITWADADALLKFLEESK